MWILILHLESYIGQIQGKHQQEKSQQEEKQEGFRELFNHNSVALPQIINCYLEFIRVSKVQGWEGLENCLKIFKSKQQLWEGAETHTCGTQPVLCLPMYYQMLKREKN